MHHTTHERLGPEDLTEDIRPWPIALIIAIGTGIITVLIVAAAIFTVVWMLP